SCLVASRKHTRLQVRALAHAHEGAHRVGDGLFRIVLVGDAAGEDDGGRHPVALGEAEDVLVRIGRVHVVDAQVQGRAHLEVRQEAHGGNAAGGVHQGGDGATVDHAVFGIADDLLAV